MRTTTSIGSGARSTAPATRATAAAAAASSRLLALQRPPSLIMGRRRGSGSCSNVRRLPLLLLPPPAAAPPPGPGPPAPPPPPPPAGASPSPASSPVASLDGGSGSPATDPVKQLQMEMRQGCGPESLSDVGGAMPLLESSEAAEAAAAATITPTPASPPYPASPPLPPATAASLADDASGMGSGSSDVGGGGGGSPAAGANNPFAPTPAPPDGGQLDGSGLLGDLGDTYDEEVRWRAAAAAARPAPPPISLVVGGDDGDAGFAAVARRREEELQQQQRRRREAAAAASAASSASSGSSSDSPLASADAMSPAAAAEQPSPSPLAAAQQQPPPSSPPQLELFTSPLNADPVPSAQDPSPTPTTARPDPFEEWWQQEQRGDVLTLAYAVGTGALVAASVFAFDVSIQYIHDLPDIFSRDLHVGGGRATGLEIFGTAVPFRCIMPVGAGFAVAWLQGLGFSPGLKFLTRAIEGVVDDDRTAALPKSWWQVFRKAAASAITLGSGASLGPEAPSVELGANTAAVLAPKGLSKRRQRMLVAAGAAAGVSAAFDAPATGALFAVEFVLKSSRLGLDRLSIGTVFAATSVSAGTVGFLRAQGQALGLVGATTHLVGRIPYFSLQPNLLTDVLQFSVLGVGCAAAAVALYEGVRVSEAVLRPLPRWASAPLGGALCGAIALKFPQVQYGYVNLEEIFRDSTRLSVGDLSALLVAKVAATSVCAGGGLVGGLFAPSLFLGALVGDIMGHYVVNKWGVADPTTLVVVGAAAVLGAACRAPLTAVALMVEITRDTGLLVPLLAAIGVASLASEYVEGALSSRLEAALAGIYLREKALFWGAHAAGAGGGALGSGRGGGVALSSADEEDGGGAAAGGSSSSGSGGSGGESGSEDDASLGHVTVSGVRLPRFLVAALPAAWRGGLAGAGEGRGRAGADAAAAAGAAAPVIDVVPLPAAGDEAAAAASAAAAAAVVVGAANATTGAAASSSPPSPSASPPGSPGASGRRPSSSSSSSSSSEQRRRRRSQRLVAEAENRPVESVMATRADLYVRHTLPLAQAKRAMAARGSGAAVVVDDAFSPLGLVRLQDIEAELEKARAKAAEEEQQ